MTPRAEARRQEGLRRSRNRGRRARLYPTEQVVALAMRGVGQGFVQTGHTKGEWTLSPTCHNPIPVEHLGAASTGVVRPRRARGSPFTLTLYTKCRRCPDCLKRRRNLWAYRAQEEITASVRTWFATFTLAPVHHARMRMRASARLRDRGTNLELLPTDEGRAEVSAEYRRELTLYFKRVRKQTGVNLRYLLVEEEHKSGLPHFHALIHEVSRDQPIRHHQLTSQWNLGHTKFKLVDGLRCAWYVAKYLAKSALSRVRASLHYGNMDKTASGRSDQRGSVTTLPPTREKTIEWCPSLVPQIKRMLGGCEADAEFITKGTTNAIRRICENTDKITANPPDRRGAADKPDRKPTAGTFPHSDRKSQRLAWTARYSEFRDTGYALANALRRGGA